MVVAMCSFRDVKHVEEMPMLIWPASHWAEPLSARRRCAFDIFELACTLSLSSSFTKYSFTARFIVVFSLALVAVGARTTLLCVGEHEHGRRSWIYRGRKLDEDYLLTDGRYIQCKTLRKGDEDIAASCGGHLASGPRPATR